MPDSRIVSGRVAVPEGHRGSAFFLIRGGADRGEEGKKRKQEKGNASQALLCDCLHIVLLRDSGSAVRDMLAKIGGNAPFSKPNREIFGCGGSR